MSASQAPSVLGRTLFSVGHGALLKMLGILFLALLLLIPLSMISSVLSERLSRRDQAIADITSTWGKEQVIVGPLLVIPHRYSYKAWKEETVNGKVERREVIETAVANAFFLPAALTVEGAIDPSRLHRGIYQAVVYNGKLRLAGEFARPDFDGLKVNGNEVLWDEAVVTLAVTDLRGTRETLDLVLGEKRVALTPGTRLAGFPSGVQARVTGLQGAGDRIPFVLELTLNGSSRISFAPVGIQNRVTLASTWPDPSFGSAFLPTQRQVTPQGFQALWQISYYGRDYPQQWTDRDGAGPFNANSVAQSLFGVALVSPIDAYRKVERSIKYGVLFITLVFTAFFLFEILASLRIHPLKYLLIGAALCLFYLALLSLSEFLIFLVSYVIAATAATSLISLYSLKVLNSGARTLIIAAGLVATYGFLYVILQLQDYSLLVGTIGLFIALAIVMYATRDIDWYARDERQGIANAPNVP